MENRKFKAMEMDRKQEVTMSYATACAEVCCVLASIKHQALSTCTASENTAVAIYPHSLAA